ncbi:TatD family hydrolase [Vulcanisaeta distributa]|uniref:TatD-related deoxyribonuclease n=1 Tax=Vulcanisaeta distributa (strain DSM 14429 / JCM 11212 / NBRC 100878 / IC-017) TaxID=572478 RepID=E1QR33_VULDI|nr:TatD family hydrolase [Vulcanisaeta distributa]ADN51723.1 TatD-related deoxyribonuclease [Vulcanisaeta distributa DSM 14429]
MIDTHAHLSRWDVYDHADELVREARREGLLAIINVTMRLNEVGNALSLVSRYGGFVYTALGYDYGGFDIREVQEIMRVINERRNLIVGIGEVGLDYSVVRDRMLREISRHIFTKWIMLARDLDLPLIIHSRDAEDDVIKLLSRYGPVKCVMHAFNGSKEQVMKLLELGCYFSIPPTITRSRQKRDLAMMLPLNRILLESDTPELGPSPGEVSRPVHIKVTLTELSSILNINVTELSNIIVENTLSVFQLGKR